jgi:uncharacterized protein (TIGR03118 family)
MKALINATILGNLPAISRLLAVGTLLGATSLGLAQNAYLQHNLVSDLPGVADNLDTNLVNPWGIAISATSPFWIADNGTGLSTLCNSTGAIQSRIVIIPPPAGGTPPAAPSGIVFNGTTNFIVVSNAAAKFIFSTEDGTISGWASGNDAVLKVDNSSSNAVYKGLALASANGSNYLYATDFHNGRVDVFDGSFNPVAWPGAFADTNIPAGFAPFGIQIIGTNLFISYAKQDAEAHDDVAGTGNGFVDSYDTSGHLIKRLISNGALNSPWGMTLAPASFGLFGGQLLVGNFGDGTINAFDPASGTQVGTIKDTNGAPFAVEGLWGLTFGNGGSGGATNLLYFTAGIAGGGQVEDHGLFASLAWVAPKHTAGTANITVGSGGTLTFSPAVATVNAGDQIVWTWAGNFHSTTSGTNGAPSGLWDSGVFNEPHTYTNTLSVPGNYEYYCSIHFSFGMTGVLQVNAVELPPAALLYSPATGSVFAAPANVTVRATTADSDAAVTNLAFLVGSAVLTNEAAPPYSAVASDLAPGDYVLSAIATDNNGLTATNSVPISVVAPTPITLSQPTLPGPGQFQLSYLVNTGLTYVVQFSTNLETGQWAALATNTAASNPVVFLDLDATNNAGFYRVTLLPNP